MAVSKDVRENVFVGMDGSYRFVTTAMASAAVAADYKFSLRGLEYGTPEYRAKRKECHQRAADRMLAICKKHGGLYTKAGQYIASMNHVLPPEYTETLSVLQDRATPRPWGEVQHVLRQELGGELADHFAEFEEKPLATASLAQVHRAVTVDGDEVAVKVQHKGLEQQTRGDLQTLSILMRTLGYLFPDFEFSWMLPEFEDTTSLELNFVQEASNGQRVAKMFAHREDVHVPAIHAALSTRRVLTMEFIRGIKVNNIDGLKAEGINTIEVANKVSEVFGEMIHFHGFVHCDPHPGNLLVRKVTSTGVCGPYDTTQLVVLDHGMYRRLDQRFRAAYCRLWKGMIMSDVPLVKEAAEELGVAQFAEVLPLMLIYRPVKKTGTSASLGSMSVTEREELKAKFKGATFGDLNRFMESLPRDMMFVLRSTNLVRALNKQLGGTSRQRMRIMAEAAIRGLSLDEAYRAGDHSVGTRINVSAGEASLQAMVDLGLSADGMPRKLTASVITTVPAESATQGGSKQEEAGGSAEDGGLQTYTAVATITAAGAGEGSADGGQRGDEVKVVTEDGEAELKEAKGSGLFSPHTINMPVDSERAHSRNWKQQLSMGWDVANLRSRTAVMDVIMSAMWWWRGDAPPASRPLKSVDGSDADERHGHRGHGHRGQMG